VKLGVWSVGRYGSQRCVQKLLVLEKEFMIPLASRDSVVGIATTYGLDDRGVEFRVPVGQEFSSRCPDRLWSPPNLLSNGYLALSLGFKRPGREANHSLPVSAEVKKMWIYTSTPP
jgi:hypothetical protein